MNNFKNYVFGVLIFATFVIALANIPETGIDGAFVATLMWILVILAVNWNAFSNSSHVLDLNNGFFAIYPATILVLFICSLASIILVIFYNSNTNLLDSLHISLQVFLMVIASLALMILNKFKNYKISEENEFSFVKSEIVKAIDKLINNNRDNEGITSCFRKFREFIRIDLNMTSELMNQKEWINFKKELELALKTGNISTNDIVNWHSKLRNL